MTPDQEHRYRLIEAYTKAPELLKLRLADVFAVCVEPGEVAVSNDAVRTVMDMVGDGLSDMCERLSPVILEVAKNQMMKEKSNGQ